MEDDCDMPVYENPTAVPPAPIEGASLTEEEDPALAFLADLRGASAYTIAQLHALVDVALAIREGTAELPALPPAPSDVLSPVGQFWKVWGNDPIDQVGATSVHLAVHSAGKPEMIAKGAFPAMPADACLAWIRNMPADDVWRDKKGGNTKECKEDARRCAQIMIADGLAHGANLRVWGCGMGMDRMVQCSMKTGWFSDENMVPAKGGRAVEYWAHHGIRSSPFPVNPRSCASCNLDEHGDGTGTYKVEIYQDGLLKTHFFLGVFPHPGSTGWSQATANLKNAVMFLRDLTAGTPKQTHIIKFNADEYG